MMTEENDKRGSITVQTVTSNIRLYFVCKRIRQSFAQNGEVGSS